MVARAIGSVTVSFGLVSIPVKLYSTSQPASSISFHMLHKKDGKRLKQQYICPLDGETVTREEMSKGYEFAKDQYVQFTEDEIKELQEPPSQAIDITEFLPADKIDPVFFDKAYYLGTDKGGERAYKLLLSAMRETGRVAIGKYAARGKQYLVMVRPAEKGLIMQQLYYADEVRAHDEVPIEDAEVKEMELALAVQLVEQASAKAFRPEIYEDDVKKRMQEVINKKIEGQEVTLAPAEAPKAQIIDLMEALKASLQNRAPAAAAASSEEAAEPERKPAKRAARGDGAAKVARKSSRSHG